MTKTQERILDCYGHVRHIRGDKGAKDGDTGRETKAESIV